MPEELAHYRYRGARALVLLHDRHLRSFLVTWREAKVAAVALPETDNAHYASMDTLLRHVLTAARGYMTWICEKLELPDPGINAVPEVAEIEAHAEAYINHLLERWRLPLAAVEEERFFKPSYTTRWGIELPIEGMLEHAVMHPIRHQFQLENLLQGDSRDNLGRV